MNQKFLRVIYSFMAINIKTGHFREKDKSRYLRLFIHDQLLLEKFIFVEAIINVYQK